MSELRLSKRCLSAFEPWKGVQLHGIQPAHQVNSGVGRELQLLTNLASDRLGLADQSTETWTDRLQVRRLLA